MSSLSCTINACLGSKSGCATTGRGGLKKIWATELGNIASVTWESINGTAKGRIRDLVMKPGKEFFEVFFNDQVGAQLNTEGSSNNGIPNWTHTLTFNLDDTKQESIDQIERWARNRALVFVVLNENGRYYITVDKDLVRGLRFAGGGMDSGRASSDYNGFVDIAFANDFDTIGQELLAGNVSDDLDTRLAATETLLAGIEHDCETATLTLSADDVTQSFTDGFASKNNILLTVEKLGFTGDVDIIEIDAANMPTGVTVDALTSLPLLIADPALTTTLTLDYDGTAAGTLTGSLTIQAVDTATGLILSNELVIFIEKV